MCVCVGFCVHACVCVWVFFIPRHCGSAHSLISAAHLCVYVRVYVFARVCVSAPLCIHRSGQMRFREFKKMGYGRMDGPTDQQTDRRTDGRTDGPTDGRTDKAGCRVACTRLKMKVNDWLLGKTQQLMLSERAENW